MVARSVAHPSAKLDIVPEQTEGHGRAEQHESACTDCHASIDQHVVRRSRAAVEH